MNWDASLMKCCGRKSSEALEIGIEIGIAAGLASNTKGNEELIRSDATRCWPPAPHQPAINVNIHRSRAMGCTFQPLHRSPAEDSSRIDIALGQGEPVAVHRDVSQS